MFGVIEREFFKLLEPRQLVTTQDCSEKMACLNDTLEQKRSSSEEGNQPVILLNGTFVANVVKDDRTEMINSSICSRFSKPVNFQLSLMFTSLISNSKEIEDIKTLFEEFIKSKAGSFFNDGIHNLVESWCMVIEN